MTNQFNGRVGIVQRVLPRYRAPFFDMLAQQCKAGLSVFAGQPRPSEAIPSADKLSAAKWQPAQNLHLFGGWFYLCYQRGLFNWLKDWDPDVLIVEANPRYLSTSAAVRWMQARHRPVIGWGLGTPPPQLLAGFRNWQRKLFLGQFDALIAYSRRGASEYRTLGFSTERVFIAPNAVTVRPQGSSPKKDIDLKNRPIILYVGRLQARKRIDSLLRACAGMPARLQPRLQIVGEGPELASLQRLAANIYPQTEFAGARFGDELETFFTQADLFVLPGTGGLAVQQAMAHGLPVVVAEGDGSQEDMVQPANGWLIPPGDEAALKTALAEALGDRARLRKMGEASYQQVQQTFNLENMTAAFITALNAAIR